MPLQVKDEKTRRYKNIRLLHGSGLQLRLTQIVYLPSDAVRWLNWREVVALVVALVLARPDLESGPATQWIRQSILCTPMKQVTVSNTRASSELGWLPPNKGLNF